MTTVFNYIENPHYKMTNELANNTYFNDDPRYVREKVLYLESEMKKMPQVNIAVMHYFSEGVYAREMFIPKGVMLTGKIHKYTQLNILSKGEMSVLIDEEVIKIKAPYTFVAKTGSKRVFLAHEDSIWTVIHGTHETDLEKIEAHFIAETEQEYLEFCGQISMRELTEYKVNDCIINNDDIVKGSKFY